MKVVVTGASGYVGSRLVPALLDAGHEVRAGFTDPAKAEGLWWADDVEVVRLNLDDKQQVANAVQGADALYYLVHGMAATDFARTDRDQAQRVLAMCEEHGVGRIVYLSGLVPPVPKGELSEHIASRLQVERILSGGTPTAITLRAAVVMGAGSTSFEIIRQISERLPIQTVPDWMTSEVQPIAVVDVIAALVGALTVERDSRHYDVGGPDRMPYPELLRQYAEVAGISRPQVSVPLLPDDLVGSLAGLLTDVPSPTVEALVESLHHDMVCGECDFVEDLLAPGHHLLTVEESLHRSLAAPQDAFPVADRDPMTLLPHDPDWAGGSGGPISTATATISAVASGLAERISAAVSEGPR